MSRLMWVAKGYIFLLCLSVFGGIMRAAEDDFNDPFNIIMFTVFSAVLAFYWDFMYFDY